MTMDTGSRGLRFAAEDNTTRLVDVRCGACAACRAGRDYWCLDARESGPVLSEVDGVDDAALVQRWTSALAALAATGRDRTAPLLMLGEARAEEVRDLVAPWHEGDVVVAADAHDPQMRARLATLSVTGRAPRVLTVTDVRAAVRAVQRGGEVYGPDAAVALPSVTELVQRDVTLVSARRIDALVAGSSWTAFATAMAAVLGTRRAAGVSR